MSAIMAFLSAKGSALAIGAAIPFVFMIAGKMIPKKLANATVGFINGQLGRLDKIEDPKRKELYMCIAIDLVRLAEYEMPDAGKGKERYHMVADKLCAMLPILKGQEDRIEALIESSVDAMDAELKKITPP